MAWIWSSSPNPKARRKIQLKILLMNQDEENGTKIMKRRRLAYGYLFQLEWRDNLAQKANDDYLETQAESENLMKIVYRVFNAFAKVRFLHYFLKPLVRCQFITLCTPYRVDFDHILRSSQELKRQLFLGSC